MLVCIAALYIVFPTDTRIYHKSAAGPMYARLFPALEYRICRMPSHDFLHRPLDRIL